MLDTVKNWLDVATNFCKENTELMLVIGAGIIVIIIIIAIIKSLVHSMDDDDFDFDEIEYVQESRREEIERAKRDILKENRDEYEFAANRNDRKDFKKFDFSREEKGSTLDDVLDELNKLGNNNLDQVQLKIKDAEFVVKYKDGRAESIKEVRRAKVESEAFDDDKAEEIISEVPQEDLYEEVTDTEVIGTEEATVEVEKIEEPTAEPIDQIAEKLVMRKFGPDNLNVTRSGKVFTEEELKKQIRD